MDTIERLKLEHELERQRIEIQQLKDNVERLELTKEQFYELAQQNGKLIAHYIDGQKQEIEEPKPRPWWSLFRNR